jgi:hypothetical protein
MENNSNRCNFIKKAAPGGFIAVIIPEILSASLLPSAKKKNYLSRDNILLFQGDSVTDAGRIRDNSSFNNARALGSGYPELAGGHLTEQAWVEAVK